MRGAVVLLFRVRHSWLLQGNNNNINKQTKFLNQHRLVAGVVCFIIVFGMFPRKILHDRLVVPNNKQRGVEPCSQCRLRGGGGGGGAHGRLSR